MSAAFPDGSPAVTDENTPMLAARAVPFALAALALISPPAHADIRGFNTAVQSGDYAAALAEADATWPTLNQGNAAVAAREFAWVAMLAGEPTRALSIFPFSGGAGRDALHARQDARRSPCVSTWAWPSPPPAPPPRAPPCSPRWRSRRCDVQPRPDLAPRSAGAPHRSLDSRRLAPGRSRRQSRYPLSRRSRRSAIGLPATEARRTQAVAGFDAHQIQRRLHRSRRRRHGNSTRSLPPRRPALFAYRPRQRTSRSPRRRFRLQRASVQPPTRTDRHNTVSGGRPAMVDLLFPVPGDPCPPALPYHHGKNAMLRPAFPSPLVSRISAAS